MDLTKYLTAYYKKTHPLEDFKSTIQVPFDELFEEEWLQGSLYGWEQVLLEVVNRPDQESTLLFCKACNKAFQSQSVFDHHLQGKKHQAALKAGDSGKQEALVKKLKTIAYLESWVLKLC